MSSVKGDLPAIVRNDADLYEGDLRHYFRVLCRHATNLGHPYHNFRHVSHVLWLCYQACVFYREEGMTRESMRTLLIAALFHDFNHSGRPGPDKVNIEAAIMALEEHLLPEDMCYLEHIKHVIKATEFPYTMSTEEVGFLGKIIRDADMGQAFSVAWIQQVIYGLAEEWGKTPLEVLKMQGGFLGGLKLHTTWARSVFTPEVVQEKIDEARELLEILAETEVSV